MIHVHLPMVYKYRSSLPLGAAVYSGNLANRDYLSVLANYQQITPEVEGGYWWVCEHGWGGMDKLSEYARSNGLDIFYHCLRWWWDKQPPDVAAWITEAMRRYPDISDWVVVNEGYNCWTGEPTIPQIEESYYIAQRVLPAARLWYNGLLFDSLEQSRAMALVDAGLCDAIGIQMHHDLDDDCARYEPLVEWLQSNHVPWAVTELDVIIPNTLPDTLIRQAEAYGRVTELCLDYGAEFCAVWGVADCVSWQYDYYPLPFGRDYKPKPAWAILSEGL